MLESTLAALLRSSSKRADLDKPEGHSPTPYKTTLNFLSELGNTLDKDFSPATCLGSAFMEERVGSKRSALTASL